ncbi:fimbrial biogenesis chaperone [Yersinia intermedia]|uniref:fimbrial biogenesis chaperone n=1 Tax=Yersinia intermedia TaxID=631 RepID=UPI0005E5CAE2|nr:molecular chaperone [Yersinia intermedia]MDA5512861.1 molecular chaperone [Yersinia intermedia]CNI73588.1 putative fimbrial chaperone protein [Yersinia intermedia]
MNRPYSASTSVFYLLLLCAALLPTGTYAIQEKPGLTLQSTRVIYPASATGGITFSVTNNTQTPYLMQSRIRDWGGDIDGTVDTPAPFVALPPLKRLEPGDKLTLRIRLMNAYLRQDRESVFTLALKAIPAQSETSATLKASGAGSALVIATQNQLKLFYRPAGLPAYGADGVAERLSFHWQGQQLRVDNPTPFWVTLGTLTLGGQPIKTVLMVPPFGQQSYPLGSNVAGNELAWQLVNDHGVLTPRKTRTLPSAPAG